MRKNIYFFLILVLILNACTRQDELFGTWIGAYEIHHPSDEPVMARVRVLLQFDGNKLTVKNMDLLDSLDEISGTYSIEDGNLLFGTGEGNFDTLKVVSITSDSLVFEVVNLYRRQVVYRRFNEDLSPANVDLVGRTYAMNSNKFTDSLEFISNTQLLHLSEFSYQVEPWMIKSFNGYKFLIIGQFAPPFFIKSISGDSLRLVQFADETTTTTLNKLPRIENSFLFVGDWIESSRSGRELYPPTLTRIQLSIDKDSMKMVERKAVRTMSWKLDATANWIYFDDELASTEIQIWHVVEVTSDRLTIERRTLHFQEDRERIEFVRK